MTSELKPCPFCGSDGEQQKVSSFVRCSNPGCVSWMLVERWKTRVTAAPERPEAITDLYVACADADWEQVVGNGGPPCFHLEGARFCLRAKRWHGHEHGVSHRYVSLLHLIDSLRPMQDHGIVQPEREEGK
jgi:hypothetical protein